MSEVHKLINGDAILSMSKLPDKYIDCIIVDPPYGKTNCCWDKVIPLDDMWKQIKRIIKDKGNIVFTSQNPFTSALIMSNVKWFRQSLVWAKNKPTGFLNANRRHLTKHEDIVLFSSGAGVYNPQKIKGCKLSNSATRKKVGDCYNNTVNIKYKGGNTERYPTTLIEIPVMNNDGSHGIKLNATQKPVKLMEYLINTYSKKGDIVLDFAMGSGTTGVACAKLCRSFIGIDSDKQIYEKALQRIMEVKDA